MANIKKEFVDTQVSAFMGEDAGDGHLLHKHDHVMDLILSNSTETSDVLDVGCSDGKILKELESRGYVHLFGVDIQEMSKTTFKGHRINYRMCDIESEKIPFKKQFDIIIVSDVLEHLFSPQTVLYDFRQYLKPHGKVIFSFPNAGWFLNGLLLTFFPSKLFVSTAFGPWGHTYQFTFYQARRMAEALKYKVKVLEGGTLDNYAFKSGMKKVLFDAFVWLTAPLARYFPIIFSAHIFGVFEKTATNPSTHARFDVGI